MRPNILSLLVVIFFFGLSTQSVKVGTGVIKITTEPLFSNLDSLVLFKNGLHPTNGKMVVYFATQLGKIYWFDPQNPTQVNLFADLSLYQPPIQSAYDERGFLGLAFHPKFTSNGRFYTWATSRIIDGGVSGCHCNLSLYDSVLRLREYKYDLSGVNPPVVLGSVLKFKKQFADHNSIDAIDVSSDGYLYVAIGDGGCNYDPFERAQDPDSIFGKILQIDIKRKSNVPLRCKKVLSEGKFSEIERLCPKFASRVKTVAMGIRNPGALKFINSTEENAIFVDVGEFYAEEVNLIKLPSSNTLNLGWDLLEGFNCVNQSEDPCPNNVVNYTYPYDLCKQNQSTVFPLAVGLHENDERLGNPHAFIGGNIFRSSKFSCLKDYYIFSDFISQLLYSVEPRYQSSSGSSGSYVNALQPTCESNPIGECFTTPFYKAIGIHKNEIYIGVSPAPGTGTTSDSAIYRIKYVSCP